MSRRRLVTYAAAAVFVLGAAALALGWYSAPRLVSVSPAAGVQAPSGAVTVRLTFSRPVRPESLQTHVRFAPDVPGQWALEGNSAVFTPEQPWQPGETVHVTVSGGLKAANGLPLLRGKTWSFHIAPVLLAYVSPPEGGDIYILDTASGQSRRLTTTKGVLGYAPSANGRFVYFSAVRGVGVSLFVAERQPHGQPAKIAMLLDCGDDQCLSPAPSPDGRWLAYVRSDGPGGAQRVHLMRLNDHQEADAIPATHLTYGPMWSPQGLLAYYDGTRRGYVVLAPESGQEQAFLPNDTGENAAWAPDGHAIVAVEMLLEKISIPNATPQAPSQAPYLAAHLWLYRFAPQQSRTDLTRDPNLEDATPAFSPDGRWLAFGRKALDPAHWTPGRQLWLMHPDGSYAHQITHAPNKNHLDFAWHPTEPWLAYARTDQTNFTLPPEIWLYDLQTGEQRMLVSNAIMPRWLP